MKKILRAPGFIILSEAVGEDGLIEVQLLKTGTFKDPRYGKFSITRKMFSEMIDNFKKGTRGQEISIDYIHKADDVAAAWIKELYEKPYKDGYGLFAKVKPTGSGKKSLSEEEFKYLSADFDPNYIDNEKGEKHGCVLEGAALTNRPVIKGMQPVQLSEELTGEDANMDGVKPYEEIEIELNEMKNKYSPLIKLMEENKMSLEDVLKLIKPSSEGSMAMTEQEQKELADAKAEAAALKAEKEAAETKLQLSEKNSKFDKMLAEGKACEAQRKAYIAGDMDEFAKLATKVKFSEDGSGTGHAGDGEDKKDIEDEIAEAASKMVSEDKIKLSEAIKIVSKKPEFAKRLAEKFE